MVQSQKSHTIALFGKSKSQGSAPTQGEGKVRLPFEREACQNICGHVLKAYSIK